MSVRHFLALLPAFALLPLGQAPAREDEAPPAKLPPPKLVTLQAEKLPLGKALDEVARQTGVRVEDRRGETGPPLRLDLRDATFWQAVDAIAKAAGARVDLYARGARVALVKRPDGYHNPPTSYDGPFRLALKRVAVSEDLETRKALCSLSMEVAWVPGVTPLWLETRPQRLRLLGGDRKELPVSDQGSSLGEVEGAAFQTVDFSVPAPPRSQARLALVEGRLTAIVPSKTVTFTFDTLARLEKAPRGGEERRHTQDGVVCRLDRLTLRRDRWSVRASLLFPPGGKDLDSNQAFTAAAHNEMTLVRADDKRRLSPSDYVVESATSSRAVITYHFTPKGGLGRYRPEDWKVVYRAAGLLAEVPIKFSFRDVPLP
jgi:hypothetical protein